MRESLQFYIGGAWVEPSERRTLDVINPADESLAGRISLGNAKDIDRAVKAARGAFGTFAASSREERLALLDRVIAVYERRSGELEATITLEMGAPTWLAEQMQVVLGLAHLKVARDVLRQYPFDEALGGTTRVLKEPIGVCGFITPWNWPLNQISCKVAPALAVGCTMVLKPSEIAPFSAALYAEILHEAAVPAGVFNLVQGDGPTAGVALSSHPDVDMVSFTGSTRAGVEVAKNAASTVKRVHQELGGKSANIVLDDADLAGAVRGGIDSMMLNAGQSCNAPSRMLVPRDRMRQVIDIAREHVGSIRVGHPSSGAQIGPVVSEAQWNKIQRLIERGVAERAKLVAGGPGRPEGLERGYYVRPTIFADVTNDMTIAREEIFGPVLVILGYESEAEAIRIANDTPYGLAAYVQGSDARARAVAAQLRAGQVFLNGAGLDFAAPFGGYKQSGNGREWGAHAFGEFLETKAVMGYRSAAA
jgi:aldehyde dehydrogenase (NAD+)